MGLDFIEQNYLSNDFRILSWNVQGMATRVEDSEFQNAIKFFQLLCLQETFLKDNKKISLPGFAPGIFRSFGNGVAVFVREQFCNQIKSIDDVGHDSVIWVHAKLRGKDSSYCIACVYNYPTSSHNKNENFFDNLLEDISVLNDRYSSPHFILIGDWNARIGSLSEYTDEGIDHSMIPSLSDLNLFLPRNSCDKTVNTYGKKLISFCRQSRLYLLNGRGSDSLGEFTFLSTNGCSTIDYALVSGELMFNKTFSFHVRESLTTLHRPIVLTLLDEQNNNRQERYTQANLIKIPPKIILNSDRSRSDYIDRFELYFSMFEPGITRLLNDNIDLAATNLTDCLRMIGRPFTLKSKRVVGPVWFTNRHGTLKTTARRILRAYRKTRLPFVLQRYCVAKQRYYREIKTAKRKYNQQLVSKIENAIKNNNISLLWSFLKTSKRKGSAHFGNSISPVEWVENFKKTLQYPTTHRQEWEVAVDELPEVPALDFRITEADVSMVISKLKSGKAPGLSGVSGAQLKLVKNQIIPLLTKLFNAAYDKGRFPTSWTHALLCPLFKGVGSTENPDSYRGIALLDHVGKCFSKILKNRLSLFVETRNLLSDNQGGFRQSRSTIDNALILDTLVKSELENKGGKLYVGLVDKKRAFDLCSRTGILFRLKQLGVSKKMFCIIQSMFSDSKFSVKINSSQATVGTISTSGIFQGCSLSPLLFILFLDVIKENLDSVESFSPELAGLVVRHLLWADDLTLISRTIQGLQNLFDALEGFCSYWGLVVNPKKTKVLVFKKGARLSRNETWSINREKIKVVTSARYLGFEFSYNGNWNHHKRLATQKASGALFRLISFFFKNKNLPARIFRQLYLSLIDSILLYGSELWSVYPTNKDSDTSLIDHLYQTAKNLDKPMLRFLKLVLGVPRSAASSAVFLELGCNRLPARAIPRAVKYWSKIVCLPRNHIMSYCLRQQLSMMNHKYKPWLFYIKQIIDEHGLGYMWEQGANIPRHTIKLFKHRSNDIFHTFLFEEAQGLRSLEFYCQRKNRSVKIEKYTGKKYEERRLAALLRLNLKYALPFDEGGTCKLCNEQILPGCQWSHFLYECFSLPPLENPDEAIPYPYCIHRIISNPESVVYDRISRAFLRVKI